MVCAQAWPAEHLAHVSMQVPWIDLPYTVAAAKGGDMLIQLDCGGQLVAHSAFLAHASSILAEAIALAPKPADGNKLHVPVQCVGYTEASLLLQVVARAAVTAGTAGRQLTASRCAADGVHAQARDVEPASERRHAETAVCRGPSS